MKMDKHYDVIVIGAGLSGLTAALSLQKAGRNVLILEKNSQAGGLCGTFKLNDYEFVIGCNDFCAKVPNILKELNVPVKFKNANTRFYFENDFLDFPPTFSTFIKLMKHPIALLKTLTKLKKIRPENETLESFTEKFVPDKMLSNFIKSFSYPYGTPPQELYLDQIKIDLSREFNYDYSHPLVPVEGPAAIIKELVKQFKKAGGEIKYNVECKGINNLVEEKEVISSAGLFSADVVVTSEGRYKSYPENFKPGLAISKIVVAVKPSLNFPNNFHTIVIFPADIAQSLSEIDAGILPPELGFHFFPHYPSDTMDYYSINIYFYLPRGLNNVSPEQQEQIKNNIFARIEKILPGFKNSILYFKFISVNNFEELHGVKSIVTPIIDHTFKKPANYDEKQDIYYIGNTVYPPSNHAGAAMLSGLMVANAIKQREKSHEKVV